MNYSFNLRAAERSAARVALALLLAALCAGAPALGGGSGLKQRRSAGAGLARRAELGDIQKKHGFGLRIWLGTNGTLGESAFPGASPSDRIGLEYPVGSLIEHLYGAGIWFGAVVDTSRSGSPRTIAAVTTAYGGGSGGFTQEMYGHQTARDTFYSTGTGVSGAPNKRNFDDDHDGRTDEDDLDGYDNDGDWNPAADDVGSDGLPDSLETGCRGPYDPATNPDPAFDNYSPADPDACTPGRPLRRDLEKYTEKNGVADIGEPHVDEDYAAVSESDVYVSYTDTFHTPRVPGHYPLGIKVWQRAYAWENAVKEPIVVMEYNIINVGTRTLDSVYLGYFADADVGPISTGLYYTSNFSGYLGDVRTAFAMNAVLRPSTPIGFTVLGTPRPLSALRYTFQWHAIEDNPATDPEAYRYMSSGIIKPDEPIDPGSDTQNFLGFGPFEAVRPGDTLKVTIGIESGQGIEQGENNLKANAVKALELYNRGYTVPEIPPSPPLRFSGQGNDRVTLHWDWRPGDPRLDPLETWDDSNKYVDVLPDSHWRRRNPPSPGRRGGRIFEGFRLWRSESPIFSPPSFALLKQFDVDDELHFEYDTGLLFTFVDSGLVRGKRYWYSVTSFSIPGAYVVIVPDTGGGPPRVDTLITAPVESGIGQNARLLQLPFAPSANPGEVKVVPNPYRTDADYTYEGGGWEGLGHQWTENRRVVWFIHLPAKSVIRIFSLAGEVVSTISHDDALRTTPDRPTGQEEWNLLSESGRAIASGIYLFTVESDFGRQVGKFVVIR